MTGRPTEVHMRIKTATYHTIEENGCWRWLGNISSAGYGRLRIAGRAEYAHRYYYVFYKNKLTPGKVLDHLCKNRYCVNPEHIEEVSYYTNNIRGTCYINSVKRKKINAESKKEANKIIKTSTIQTCCNTIK